MPLSELARLVQGTVVGDATVLIEAARPVTEAGAGDITFLEDPKNSHLLHNCRASAVVAGPAVPANGLPLLRVDDPLGAFVMIVRHFRGTTCPRQCGIDPRAAVHPTATLGTEVRVDPFAVVGAGATLGDGCHVHSGAVIGERCRLGRDVTVHPNAVLYADTVLGDRVTVHANTVLGADGFGYRFQNGRHVKVPQLGHVEVGDDVEIGACTTIDRGTFQATRIGAGTKVDNLVQIGHNCQIGQHNIFVSQIGIAGSSSTGDYVTIAGQAGIVDHVHIGTGAVVGAKAGVTKDVAPRERILGAPARPERDQKRMLMSLEKLPDMRRDLKRIKRHLNLPEEE